jgi:PII-like signaling protein
MKNIDITIVRIYLTETSSLVKKLIEYLKNDAKVRGVTVFRAITGFGDDKKIREASLVDLSLDLPIVIEFFDDKDKAMLVIDYLSSIVKPEHVVFWDAKTN